MRAAQTQTPCGEDAEARRAHDALLTDLARTVDRAARETVVVFGSPPPQGRDLDVLVREPQRRALEAYLAREGLVGAHGKWARFGDCSAAAIELAPVGEWALPPAEVDDLFTQALPLEGFQNLALPAPHHQLLIAALRVARSGRYGQRLRARVERAGAVPGAWREARWRAPAWRAVRALALLRALHEQRRPGLRISARAAAARVAAAPAPRSHALARFVRRRARKPAIVALSGLDGAGKSLQARHLCAALRELGMETAVIWPPAANVLFQANPTVKRRLFALLDALGRRANTRPASSTASHEQAGYERSLPRQPAVIVHTLALLVALAQAWAFRRGARHVSRRAEVLIYDRYALDSIVYLRHRWGQGRELRLQSALIRVLSRRARGCFLLEVAPETAFARKRDFPLENLRERGDLYATLHRQLGCTRLDGERAPELVCADIARAVWEGLA
jgi:thymidylate kinase